MLLGTLCPVSIRVRHGPTVLELEASDHADTDPHCSSWLALPSATVILIPFFDKSVLSPGLLRLQNVCKTVTAFLHAASIDKHPMSWRWRGHLKLRLSRGRKFVLAGSITMAASAKTVNGYTRMSNNVRPTRYSYLSLKDIVCLCVGPCDDEAWEEFVSRVGKPISLTVMRTASLWGGTSRSLVEDMVQMTYLKLWERGCHLLRDFAVDHPEAILGYLKKTAANATHDYFKHQHSQSSGGDKPHVSTTDLDPEAGRRSMAVRKRSRPESFWVKSMST